MGINRRRLLGNFLLLVITLFAAYINLPFFYHQDKPESFGFFSDAFSTSLGLEYERCKLESISSVISDSVDFYFGCWSSQLKRTEEPHTAKKNLFLFWGNCGHVKEFDNYLPDNRLPDFFIEFPFEISGIGRACRGFTNGKPDGDKIIDLDDWFAGHFNGRNNTLIVEWGDPPAINEFRFFGKQVFKNVSFERLAINYFISQRPFRKGNHKRMLSRNPPKDFVFELKIPKRYTIENIEEYELASNLTWTKDSDKYLVITAHLNQKTPLHFVVTDPTRQTIKLVVNLIWSIFVAGILVHLLIKLFGKKSTS